MSNNGKQTQEINTTAFDAYLEKNWAWWTDRNITVPSVCRSKMTQEIPAINFKEEE